MFFVFGGICDNMIPFCIPSLLSSFIPYMFPFVVSSFSFYYLVLRDTTFVFLLQLLEVKAAKMPRSSYKKRCQEVTSWELDDDVANVVL